MIIQDLDGRFANEHGLLCFLCLQSKRAPSIENQFMPVSAVSSRNLLNAFFKQKPTWQDKFFLSGPLVLWVALVLGRLHAFLQFITRGFLEGSLWHLAALQAASNPATELRKFRNIFSFACCSFCGSEGRRGLVFQTRGQTRGQASARMLPLHETKSSRETKLHHEFAIMPWERYPFIERDLSGQAGEHDQDHILSCA